MLGSGSMVRRQTGKRQPPKQCNGVTKQGCRCSITSDCELKDSSGARVSDPLLHGGARCLFHTEIFTYCPCVVTDGLVFFLDFETTGLNVLKHHIVEIAVLSQCNAVFQTVVCPPLFSAEPGVHGIHDDELREGRLSQKRLRAWLYSLTTSPALQSRMAASPPMMKTCVVHHD